MFKLSQREISIAFVTYLVINAFLYVAFKPPAIATVDVNAITSEFIKKEAQKKHSESDKRVAIQAFSHRLETALTVLAQKKHLVLLPREAVIKGSNDYTEMLESMIVAEPK